MGTKRKKIGYKEFIIQSENLAQDLTTNLENNASTFEIGKSLRDRVGSDLKFKDYYGDLINLPIKLDDVSRFTNLINYFSTLDMFCERIKDEYLYLTVHNLSFGKSNIKLNDKMAANLEKTTLIFSQIKKTYLSSQSNQTINLKASSIFPFNGLGLACMMIPKDEKSYQILIDIFEQFEEVIPLRELTGFYVIINYFQPRVFRQMEITNLYSSIRSVKVDFEIAFELNQLSYQRFTSLNNYQTLLRI